MRAAHKTQIPVNGKLMMQKISTCYFLMFVNGGFKTDIFPHLRNYDFLKDRKGNR